jgi:uncharacterized protein (TIGR01777 family)
MPTILITGGTGVIGSALSRLFLEKGYRVIVLSREANRRGASGGPGQGSPTIAHWDPGRQIIDPAALAAADHIIHLAGAGVADQRWSAKRKKEIVDSRTVGSTLIVKALREIPNKVQTVVSASAIGWYGADPIIPNPHPFTETDPAAGDFLGETCRLWESAISPVANQGKRLVILRTGIVLNKGKGALEEFRKPLRAGIAAILGNGRQMISWIHIDDLCRQYLEAIERKDWQGMYNAVAPTPVNNKTLTLELARRLKGGVFVTAHVPGFILKMALGGMSVEVLKSATVSAEKTRKTGFQFLYPSVEGALKELTSS